MRSKSRLLQGGLHERELVVNGFLRLPTRRSRFGPGSGPMTSLRALLSIPVPATPLAIITITIITTIITATTSTPTITIITTVVNDIPPVGGCPPPLRRSKAGPSPESAEWKRVCGRTVDGLIPPQPGVGVALAVPTRLGRRVSGSPSRSSCSGGRGGEARRRNAAADRGTPAAPARRVCRSRPGNRRRDHTAWR